MGYKNIKEHFRVGHIVHVRNEGICIGSPYVSDLIIIGRNGVIKKGRDSAVNEDINRYQSEMQADPAKVRALIEAPDTFTASLPVYTYEGGKVVLHHCEQYGWPNVTHAGALMYENTFSPSRAWIAKRAKNNAQYGIEAMEARIVEIEAQLAINRAQLAEYQADLAALNAEFP